MYEKKRPGVFNRGREPKKLWGGAGRGKKGKKVESPVHRSRRIATKKRARIFDAESQMSPSQGTSFSRGAEKKKSGRTGIRKPTGGKPQRDGHKAEAQGEKKWGKGCNKSSGAPAETPGEQKKEQKVEWGEGEAQGGRTLGSEVHREGGKVTRIHSQNGRQ